MQDDVAELYAELHSQFTEQVKALDDINIALQAGHDDELLAVRQELEESIPQLQATLAELAALTTGQAPVQPPSQAQAAATAAAPAWVHPGAPCRFRFTDGRWYHGIVDDVWHQGHQNVLVQFRFPTRPFMLQPVELPPGIVVPASPLQDTSRFTVGSRVLALQPGQQLWQPAEVTALQHAAAGTSDGSNGVSSSCTVMLVETGQTVALPPTAITQSSYSHEAADGLDVSAAAAAAAGTGLASSVQSLPAAAAVGASNSSHLSASAASDSGVGASEAYVSDGASDVCEGSASEASVSGSDSEDTDLDGHQGLGLGGGAGVLDHARLAAEAGVQTDTSHFADWEAHSRGIASRLMARMGYMRGRGLGKAGSGINAPIEINMLPTRKGLGAEHKHKAHKAHGTSNSKNNQRNRGGERTRRRKAAAARHATKAAIGERQAALEAATGSEGLFAFINHSLGHRSEAADRLRDAGSNKGGSKQQQSGGAAALASAAAGASIGGSHRGRHRKQKTAQAPDRKGLVGSHEDLAAAKARVMQLTAMLERNKGNKGLAPQIEAKLAVAKRALDAAAAQHRHMHKAVADKEAADKWAKF